ncbi:MAG: hypothetical protein PHC97_03845 [Patescibacteria group bacterium]|nr:hypothetical protein [Patescibacteria group bacterium]
MENIKLIRKCEWEEVFLEWYKNEGNNQGWINLAKERGYASWADWRLNGYAKRFECAKTSWGFYEITDPSHVILNWYGGPFRTWIARYYDKEKTKSFKELVERSDVANLSYVQEIMKNYPKDSVITALKLKNGKIFVVEGMHRACALAIMAKEGKPLESKLIFAIGESDLDELPAVGKNNK